MRLLVATTLLLAILAGCFGSDEADGPVPDATRLAASDIELPDGAALEPIAGGFAAIWPGKARPFLVEVTVPQHATMLRAVSEEAGAVSMSNLETGRRRCNNPTVESFSDSFEGPVSCSSVTALDPAGTTWRVNFGGTGASDVRIEFLETALDGLLAGLDLARIDPPTHDLETTEVLFLPSHDGVRLRVEVTRPQGPGPWPAIIVSSPYYTHAVGAPPADWTYVVQDWAKRGYVMVTADVRGFADSGGCVEVWGLKEQMDQKFLVDWTAEQPWSDGNVGFYGQSYVGTTPVAAAVQAPEALKAIVTIAPVINAYEDWHYGGVPNGESTGSPAAYQVLTESTVSELPAELGEGAFLNDPAQLANNAANGLCDPTLVTRANDPRALYDSFYEERDFKKRAKDVKAAVLYTEGFEDANVKSAMIPGWFNDLTAPKLGLFGHWLHQHPPRLDCEALFVAWFETHLKGKDLGMDALPAAAIVADRDTERYASEWPPTEPVVTSLWPAFSDTDLGAQPTEGTLYLHLDHTGEAGEGDYNGQVPELPFVATYTGTLANATSLAGSATLHIRGALQGFGTAYLMAELWVGGSLVTWGQLNVAHNADHTAYEPQVIGTVIERDMPFRPTESVLPAGAEVRLVLHGVAVPDATDAGGALAEGFSFFGGTEGTRLELPGAPLSEYHPIPLTARP